ncbi:transmembrane amino acid transporter protein-domain-containing protein [Aspergillus karnatakaensis]|uniref:putative neutral amino acid permease n=1 Tax=Aspergillus karnatakaensis TaxID=1810916 RepID=UPI003CCD2309
MAGFFTTKPEHNRTSSSDNSAEKIKDKDLEQQTHAPGAGGLSDSESGEIGRQIELEADNSIKYRTCSWQKTAALLFSEYICLAIMSFPWSYSILGLVPGLILTVFIAGVVLYTSLIVWRFCLRHPHIRDVCDIGQHLFWGSKIAWYLTAVMFLLNNTFIQGLHCLVGAEWLNTVSSHGTCTIVFALVTAIASLICSIPRTFDTLSKVASVSALATFISVMLAVIFSAIEDKPEGYTEALGNPIFRATPAPGTTYIAGMNAFLNISYTFIGQITLPSFIAEMKEPRDFWKSVTAVTIAEIIVFSLVGSIVYVYTGEQYMSSPAFGSIGNEVYKKVAFSFMVPTIIFLGVLYASVSARFIFFRIFEGTRHKGNHTVVGWASWIGILAVLWTLAFIIAEVIPFFSDLLSIMSSLFDSFFGFIFWGTAYLRMRYDDYGPGFYRKRGLRGWIGAIVNVGLIGIGFYFLGPGTYVSLHHLF